MLAAITRPGGTPRDTAEVLRGSDALPAREGLGIYRHAYRSRLLECLRKEFAVLMTLMGREAFTLLASAYLEAHPPRSYTLADLGKNFPGYLKETRPPGHDWADPLIDLATLERAFNEVYDAPDAKMTRLLACRYPVHRYFTAVRSGDDPEPLLPTGAYILVHRPDEIVRFRELSEEEYGRRLSPAELANE